MGPKDQHLGSNHWTPRAVYSSYRATCSPVGMWRRTTDEIVVETSPIVLVVSRTALVSSHLVMPRPSIRLSGPSETIGVPPGLVTLST